MATLALAFVGMLLIVAAMAVGVLFGRAPISGSCGGMRRLGFTGECEICGGDMSVCESENASPPPDPGVPGHLGYDATARNASGVYAEKHKHAEVEPCPPPNQRPATLD